MTFPPPPPDRMHLQYQPAPPPPQQQAGPGGAYGPVQQRPDQPLPGQTPPPATTMAKPGTITGIQVILWIFTALAGIGDIGSAIGLVTYFNPFGLIGLAFAVYSTVQALASGVHITRGKRWAWIWSLVSAILGLALSAVAIVFGIVFIETGWVSLLVGIVLAGLYGTLLGLLCSKSARQWILMHRIQRGEVQLPGAPGGFAPGAAPERPATRPVSAAVAAVAILLLAAISAWGLFNQFRMINDMSQYGYSIWQGRIFGGTLPPWVHVFTHALVLIGALITAPLILKGRFGGRVFGTIWASFAVLAIGTTLVFTVVDSLDGLYDLPVAPGATNPAIPAFGWVTARFVLALVWFVLLLTPGVRAWTPGKGAAALVVVVQQAPYGPPPQQGGYPQQQPYPVVQPPQGPGPQQPPQPYSPQPPYRG